MIRFRASEEASVNRCGMTRGDQEVREIVPDRLELYRAFIVDVVERCRKADPMTQ